MEKDLRYLEFLALNSKEVIEKQVGSYRQQDLMQVPLLVLPCCLYLFS